MKRRAGWWFALFALSLVAVPPVVGTARGQERAVIKRAPQPAAAARLATPDYVNLSELQYRPATVAMPSGPDHEAGIEAAARGESDYAPPPAQRRTFAMRIKTLNWNSPAARASFGDQLQADGLEATPALRQPVAPARPAQPARPTRPARPQRVKPQGGPAGPDGLELLAPPPPAPKACVAPTVTLSGSTCCSFTFKDEVAGADVSYYNPSAYFASDADARAYAASIRASTPLFVPFHDPDVVLGQGWVYGNGGFHGSIDYSKKSSATGEGIDPSFEVRAAGDGRVVTVRWSDWVGNVVIIEHGATNGDRYRSVYMHLRDGHDHDVANAGAMTVTANDKKKDENGDYSRKYRYYLFAHKATHSEQQWGTNAQTIQVEPGDIVRAGQLIGYSGNTGYGGAGWGLDNDGDPTNPNTANNHLHFQMTAPNPGTSEWVFVDAYGVYEKAGSDCYDLLDETDYVRLIAPFYPSFHNVPVKYVTGYWGYYTGMGMALQTIDIHRRNDEVLASGSFQRGLPSAWYARLYMTGDDYQKWFATYGQKGFRPREISVAKDGSGAPRFTVIWKKTAGEGYVAHHGLTDADWDAKWQQYVVHDHMRVEDRVAYEVNGQRRWAAVFVKDAKPGFSERHYMSSDEFNERFASNYDEGLRLTSVDPEELSGGMRFGAIWRPMPGTWPARHGMTPAEYQSEFLKYAGQGFRLYRVRGYANSGRFAAIWTRE